MAIAKEHLDPYEWTFGDRIRKARRHAGLSQQEIADQLAIKVGRYSAWEIDEATPRDIVSVARLISDITGAPVEWLLGIRTGSERLTALPNLPIDDDEFTTLVRIQNLKFDYGAAD